MNFTLYHCRICHFISPRRTAETTRTMESGKGDGKTSTEKGNDGQWRRGTTKRGKGNGIASTEKGTRDSGEGERGTVEKGDDGEWKGAR